jgi:transcription elongation factor SPT6
MWRSANEINIFGYETLFLDLHPLQSLLSEVKAPFLSSLECVIVDAVCEAGVDLNASVQHDHLAGMLAFVGGLGLRKAEALRFNIQRQLGAITSRRQIIERKLLGKVVYKNAAGFLRICDTGTHDALLDPLDDTRIHPECYVMSDFATKMCASALEVDHNAEDYIENVTRQMQQCKRVFEQQLAAERAKHDKDNPFETAAERERYYSNWMVSTERIVQRAAAPNANCATAGADMFRLLDSLEELNLEDYAEELISQGAGKRYKQLCQIKAELRYPWLDRRIPLPLLTDSDKFSLATGETDNTLYVGMRVTCKISVVKEFSALLIINDGLKGWVSKANVSDSHFENTSDVLTEGSYVEGVIINVVKDQRRAEVSLKRSMIEYGEHKWYQERTEPGSFCFEWWRNSGRPVHLDPSFDVKEALRVYRDHEEQREAALKEAKLASAKGAADRNSGSVGLNSSGAIARQIYHPFFRNCGFAEAEGELRGRGPGEVIFRPSSKSNDTLSITWAFQEGWFKHIDVQEFDKKGGSQSIGSRLLIKGEKEEFSDLDEIMSRYITPMNDLVAKMIAHRSFKLGSVEDCNEFMRISYQSGQSSGHRQIPYLVRFDPNHPGYFVLTWFVAESVNNPIKMEYIGVTPEGYKLRDKVFKTPSELINFFKANASRSAGGGSNLGQASGASNRSRLPPPPGSMPAQQAPPPVKRSRWN